MLKINFLGDSITEGLFASKTENCFVELVGKMLPAEVRNYGICASRIADQNVKTDPRADEYFTERAQRMNHDADFIVVLGGTNDYGHGDAPFGEMGDKTPHTFYGAVDYLVNELLKHYKRNQIVFIPPLYRNNEDNPYGDGTKKVPGKTLKEYRQALVEVLNAYQIPILDIKDIMGKGENNPLLEDGLHPNDAGHHKMAELIVEYIKSKRA